MQENRREIHSILLYFRNGLEPLEFHAKYSQAKLEQRAEWQPLSEISWERMQAEGVYGGTVFIRDVVVWVPNDDRPEWEKNLGTVEKEALYIFSWSDVDAIRIVYQD